MHRILASVLVAIAAVSSATPAIAQTLHTPRPRPHYLFDTPKAEGSFYFGLWNFDLPAGNSGIGGRVTINRTPWFATEVSIDRRPRGESGGLGETLVIANARVFAREPETGTSLFVTAGLAAGAGVRRGVAPVIGIGGQSMSRGWIIGPRVEVQRFLGGPMHDGWHGRLLFGFAVEIH